MNATPEQQIFDEKAFSHHWSKLALHGSNAAVQGPVLLDAMPDIGRPEDIRAARFELNVQFRLFLGTYWLIQSRVS